MGRASTARSAERTTVRPDYGASAAQADTLPPTPHDDVAGSQLYVRFTRVAMP